jgi:uncharacterized membrane protein
LTLGAALWVSALVVATMATPQQTAVSAVYRLSSTICHQRPERSFALEGRQFPVCARCAALYFSGALGAVAAWLPLRRLPRHSRALLLIAALPTAATIAIEWPGVSPLSNAIRAAAALPFGAAAGWTFVRSLRSEGLEL